MGDSTVTIITRFFGKSPHYYLGIDSLIFSQTARIISIGNQKSRTPEPEIPLKFEKSRLEVIYPSIISRRYYCCLFCGLIQVRRHRPKLGLEHDLDLVRTADFRFRWIYSEIIRIHRLLLMSQDWILVIPNFWFIEDRPYFLSDMTTISWVLTVDV